MTKRPGSRGTSAPLLLLGVRGAGVVVSAASIVVMVGEASAVAVLVGSTVAVEVVLVVVVGIVEVVSVVVGGVGAGEASADFAVGSAVVVRDE
jgi:hypothetical protein